MALATYAANVGDVLRGRRKVYYGWWLLAASVVAMAFGSGVSFWAYGLYVDPLEEDFGWSRTEVSLGFSGALLASGLASPLVGWWVDSRGPRSAILAGAALTALTYALLATTNALWQWYLYQAFNAVFRQMMFFIPFQALMARWFQRKRGVALSVLATGFSLGGFVVVPVMGLLVEAVGWQGSFLFSAIMTAAIFLPIATFVVRNSPAEKGTVIDGGGPAGESTPALPAAGGLTAREALRTPLFWVVAAALALFFFGMFGWLVHQIPFYESTGLSRRSAAIIVSLAAGAGIVSRLSFGIIADRVRRFELVAMTAAAVLCAGMAVLIFDNGAAGIAVFLVFWVVGTGGGPMMEALLITRAFGVASFATILGAVVVVETAGQVVSPAIAAAIYDSTGAYDWALALYASTFAAAFCLFFIASRMRRPYVQT